MTLDKAIKMLTEEYERAKNMEYVQKPLAWALYQVWKKADREKEQPMKEQNEKQAIEEMAALMDGACDVMPLGECYTVDCNKCKAALLYNADYRKQSVGKWVWADDGYCRCSVCTQKAPVTTQYQDEPMTTATKYCPNCGARMKGGE